MIGLLRVALALMATVGAVAAWWLLCDWAFRKVKPALMLWIWHRLGGAGDPPVSDEDGV